MYKDIYVVNNTFFNNGSEGWAGEIANFSRSTINQNLVVKNNIFYNQESEADWTIWLQQNHEQMVMSHNLYYIFKPSNNGENSFYEEDLHVTDIKDVNPNFTNLPTDLTLQSSSIAINKGETITLPGSSELLFSTDINNYSRGSSN
ncbi:MAG: hypothetical protein PF489_16010 [Salinivirgaceae bacterium]|nr:hypothetical protein [Salinivirgaceae bacterium]